MSGITKKRQSLLKEIVQVRRNTNVQLSDCISSGLSTVSSNFVYYTLVR